MWCSAALVSRRIAVVDFVGIGQGTSVAPWAARPAPATSCQPERYRLNVAIFDIATAKAYIEPKDIQLIQRLEFVGEGIADVRSIRLIPSGRSGGAIVPYRESSSQLFAHVEHRTGPRRDGCPSPS